MVSNDWDGGLKRLVDEAPQDFVSWLMQGARYVQKHSPELALHGLKADILYEIVVQEERCLLHLEFQSEGDARMAQRVLEYNVLAHRKYHLKVYTYIIYLLPKGPVVDSPYLWQTCQGREPSSFYFGVIKLWNYTKADLKATGLKVLLPLLPLAQDNVQVDEILEDVITGLDPAHDISCRELLIVAYGVFTYTYKGKADQHRIRRRFAMLMDILKDSWGFQEIMQEGREEGLKEGLKEGIKEGQKEGLKEGQREAQVQLVQNYIEMRFPELFPLVKERLVLVREPMQLQKLVLEIMLARDMEAVRRLLLAVV